MFKDILTKEQLEQIKAHKYSPCAYSQLDSILNKYIWVPVSNHLPYAITPNMVTLSGVLALASGALLIYNYDNSLTKVLPTWVYVYLTFTVFFFQTMDAVDGKHARNTNRSSPFGQLVDHGLDIFSYAFQLAMVCAGHRLGASWSTFMYQMFCYCVYYSHSWEEYYSGVFSTQIDGVGVVEFQILAGLIIMFIPLFGENAPFFNVFGMHFSTFFAILIMILGVTHVYTTVSRTLAKIPEEQRKETVKFFYPLIPIVISLFVVQFLDIFQQYTLEIVVLNGLVFSLLTSEQIVTTTTKSPQITFHLDSCLYLVALVICLFFSLKYQIIILSLFAAVTLYRYLSYTFSVSRQIMRYLNIGF